MDEIQDVLRSIWRDKPLAITLAVGLVILVWLAFFRGKDATGGTLTDPSQDPSHADVMVYNPFDYGASAPTTTVIQVPYPTSTPSVPSPTGNQPPANALRSLPVVLGGQPLATTPGGTRNKGQNIMNLAKGVIVTLTDTKSYSYGGNVYYRVTTGGKTGYVNAKTLGL